MVQKVIIVGAGICGLAARLVLKNKGYQTLLIEKSRGLGGRCATRRLENGFADHGAQFFSMKGQNWNLLTYEDRKTLQEIRLISDAGNPRYIHGEGMSKMARFFEETHSLHPLLRETRVTKIHFDSQEILQVETQSGQYFDAHHIILTAPVPQAIELLVDSGFEAKGERDHEKWEELKTVEYNSCLTLILEVKESLHLAPQGIWKNPSSQFAGIYDQHQKGLRTNSKTIVIHASPEFSEELWHKENKVIEASMLEALHQLLRQHSVTISIDQASIHKWRYSEPKKSLQMKFAHFKWGAANLWLAGDGLLRPSVEGALDSGVSVAEEILKRKFL